MKKFINLLMVIVLVTVLFACSKKEKEIFLGTTTSVDSSGLLEYLIPYFEEDTGIKVKWVAVGTGAALEMGRKGEVDIILVHDKAKELKFMEDGYGIKRSDLMFNDFVYVGPKNQDIENSSIELLLSTIKENAYPFVSRGDNSGTHSKELSLWDAYEISPTGNWYSEVGKGMGETLTHASETKAYTLTDRPTFITMKKEIDLDIVYENKEELKNQYGIILINPDINPYINTLDAEVLYEWLISERGQDLINQYGVKEYNEGLFYANAE